MSGPWPLVPGVPAAGHVDRGGFWHPGSPAACHKGRCGHDKDEETLRARAQVATRAGCSRAASCTAAFHHTDCRKWLRTRRR